MAYLLRVLRIGADSRDAEDVRLRKVLVLSAALMVALAAGIWGVIYWMFDEPLAAAVPCSSVVRHWRASGCCLTSLAASTEFA